MLNLFGRKPASVPEPSEVAEPLEPTITFGGMELPQTEGLYHVGVIGSTGSGKTTMLRLLMQSALPRIGDGSGQRALVYDAKGDMLPLLSSFCDRQRIFTTHPFDRRGVGWDLCRDIREPRVAIEVCFTLIPREHESQPFFADAARHLMCGVMLSYLRSGIEWTLADLLRGLMRPRGLRAILKKHDVTRHLVERYFSDDRVLANILSTIATKTLSYEPIAAAWESAKQQVSIEQWMSDESILLLGNSETSRTAMDAINRCIFKRASDLTLHGAETREPRSWFILDELSEAGRLDGLVSLLKKGRSKGACVVIGFQTISGLRDPRMYGPHSTDEILGQLGSRFIGRLECPETAEWISRLTGEQEVDQYTVSHSHSTNSGAQGQNSESRSVNHQIVTRRALLPSEFLTIPPCSVETGLSGYCLLRLANPYFLQLPGEQLFSHDLLPPAADVPESLPRDVEAQYLRPWTKERAAYFGAVRQRSQTPAPISPQRTKRGFHPDDLNHMDDL